MAGMFDFFWAPDEGVDVSDIRELVPFVVRRAPASDNAEIRMALADAVHSFLCATGVWRKEASPAYASTDEVRVGSAGCARIISVESVTRVSDDTVIYRASDHYTSPGSVSARDDGAGIFTLDVPGAVTGDEYTADIVVTVRLGSELCPAWVMQQYGEAIAAKAIHELLTKGQPANTAYINEYRAAVQGVIARRAMGGSSKASAGSAFSSSLERI